jgi:tetratricopeptide (TPR) repeat protein
LENAVQIEQGKNDLAKVLSYGEKLRGADPQGAFALVTMAEEIARHTHDADPDKEERLAQVDQYAHAGLEAAKAMPKPRGSTDTQWEAAKKDYQAQAYVAMGQAARLRKKLDEAILNYREAIAIGSTPDAVRWLRLGQVCEDAGRLEDAAKAFDQALAVPGVSKQMQSIAQAKKAEVARRKGAGGN